MKILLGVGLTSGALLGAAVVAWWQVDRALRNMYARNGF